MKYSLTPEHTKILATWKDKWIENGLSTKPMDAHDKEQMRIAVRGLYKAADLTPPPDHRIVFVPSPMTGRFAAGFASAIWFNKKNKKKDTSITAATDGATYAIIDNATYVDTYDATYEATYGAAYNTTYVDTREATDNAITAATYVDTDGATEDATRDATTTATLDVARDATRKATRNNTLDVTYIATTAATRDATEAATRDATTAAARDATCDATSNAITAATCDATEAATLFTTYDATNDETPLNENWFSKTNGFAKAAKDLNVGSFGLKCAQKAWRLQTSGNFWSGSCAHLSFFRDVAKLDIDWSKYEHYEKACIHGSYRWMHEEFCIISDRPVHIKLDNGVPHCENDAYIKWSDGTGFYAWRGTRVPEWFITNPEKLTAKDAISWENVEQRRCIAEIIGWDKVLDELDAVQIDKDVDEEIGELLEADIPDIGKERFLKVQCGTGRTFALPVPPETKTALDAQAWLNFCTTEDILNLEIRT